MAAASALVFASLNKALAFARAFSLRSFGVGCVGVGVKPRASGRPLETHRTPPDNTKLVTPHPHKRRLVYITMMLGSNGALCSRAAEQSSPLTEIQRVTLIVADDELSRSPGGFMHVSNEADSILLQCFRGCGVVCF